MPETQLDLQPDRPDPLSAARLRYEGEAGRLYHDAKFAVPTEAYSWVARARAGKLARHVSEADIVVEFGVGMGWNLAALHCRERIGIDLGKHLAPTLRAHGITFIDRSEALADGSATVAVCHHVLEHVPHPADTLVELRRILAPGGRLLLFVPYEAERRYRRYVVDEPNHHLYAWNAQTLGNLVADCGFAVISAGIARYGYDRVASVWAHRLGLGEPGFHALQRSAQFIRPAWEVRIVASAPGEQA